MDEMNIISKFTTAIVSKVAKVVIKKKLGVDIHIWLKEMKITVNDGNTHAHLDVVLIKWIEPVTRALSFLLRYIYKSFNERSVKL